MTQEHNRPVEEAEATSAMIKAGEFALFRSGILAGQCATEAAVIAIYRAMRQAFDPGVVPPRDAAIRRLAAEVCAWEDSDELSIAFARRVIPILAADLGKPNQFAAEHPERLGNL